MQINYIQVTPLGQQTSASNFTRNIVLLTGTPPSDWWGTVCADTFAFCTRTVTHICYTQDHTHMTILTNRVLFRMPESMPAIRQAPLKWSTISDGTDRNVFVMGECSCIISIPTSRTSTAVNAYKPLQLSFVYLHSSSFSVDLSKLSAFLLNKCFHTVELKY